MGWKNVKEHYGIKHIVQVTEVGICIGSGYIHDLIVIGPNGPRMERGELSNDYLRRVYAAMVADPVKLRELVETPDVFEASIPVYTFENDEVVEKVCEKLGWPNITHDGCVMYDNTFSHDKAVTVARAKCNTELGIESAQERIVSVEEDLAKARARLARLVACQERLDADYPAIEACT